MINSTCIILLLSINMMKYTNNYSIVIIKKGENYTSAIYHNVNYDII